MKTFIKDPSSVLDYEWDWTDWLDTDTISTVSFVTTGGLVVDMHTVSEGKVTAWISGGVAKTQGTVTCSIITAEGRHEPRTAVFDVKER